MDSLFESVGGVRDAKRMSSRGEHEEGKEGCLRCFPPIRREEKVDHVVFGIGRSA